jgi:hypothetical protein
MRWFPRSFSLPPHRQWVDDILYFGLQTYTHGAGVTINVAAAAAARRLRQPPVSWGAIWIKAIAIAAVSCPELRTAYLPYPWPRLYVHPYAVAMIAVERVWNGARAVFADKIKNPAALSLVEINRRCEAMMILPVESIGGFRLLIRVSRFPWIVRRLLGHIAMRWSGILRSEYIGTYAVTKAARRVQVLQVISPMPFTVYWGNPDSKGDAVFQVFGDHRVADGMSSLRNFQVIEKVMNEDIVAELKACAQTQAMG